MISKVENLMKVKVIMKNRCKLGIQIFCKVVLSTDVGEGRETALRVYVREERESVLSANVREERDAVLSADGKRERSKQN